MYCDIPDFGRCCLCMPLRRGVLVIGYLSMVFSACMVFVYSYFSHAGESLLVYKGATTHYMAPALCIAIYCIDFIVDCLLVYGAHMKTVVYLKVFYYYTMLSMLAALVLQIVDIADIYYYGFELWVLAIAGMFIQLYLVLLVRSLLRKLENGSEHCIENQLHTIVLGEATADNRIYNNTTAPTAPMKDDF